MTWNVYYINEDYINLEFRVRTGFKNLSQERKEELFKIKKKGIFVRETDVDKFWAWAKKKEEEFYAKVEEEKKRREEITKIKRELYRKGYRIVC